MEAQCENGKKLKLTKEQWAILVFAGVLLVLVSFPGGKDAKSHKADNLSGTMETEKTAADDYEEETIVHANCLYWEEKLKCALEQVAGAGETEIVVYVKESKERIPLKDYDKNGEKMVENTVYFTNQNGYKSPFILKETEPAISGVLIVCQGAVDSTVRKAVKQAVCILFDLEETKVTVLPMRKRNDKTAENENYENIR